MLRMSSGFPSEGAPAGRRASALRRSVVGVALSLALAACGRPGAEDCWTATDDREHLATRPSPLDSTLVTLGDARAKVCYSRPAARDRVVMGGLVRFGSLWRLGANEATAIHLPFEAEVGGVRVAPGSYSLYAVPDTTRWTVTVNRAWERWGIPVDSTVTVDDVGSFTVPAEPIPTEVEALTMSFAPAAEGAAELVVEWERTRVRIPVRRVEGGG